MWNPLALSREYYLKYIQLEGAIVFPSKKLWKGKVNWALSIHHPSSHVNSIIPMHITVYYDDMQDLNFLQNKA